MRPDHRAEVWVGPEQAGRRLDQVLASHERVSRSAARRLIAQGAVWVDGRRVKVAGRRMRPGQRIVAYLDVPSPGAGRVPGADRAPDAQRKSGARRTAAAEAGAEVDLVSRILHLGDGIIAVNKPAGMASSPTPRSDRGVLTVELARQLKLPRPPLTVGRLDRDTSGVMVLALDRQAARRLTQLMMRGSVHKEYVAVCSARPGPDEGDWEWPLAVDLRRRGRYVVDVKRGRPARTGFAVQDRCSVLPDAWNLRFRLYTGRTHQIRVHAAHAGCPVLGDRWYGGVTEAAGPDGRMRRVLRLCLHSARWAVAADDWPVPLDLVCAPDGPFPALDEPEDDDR